MKASDMKIKMKMQDEDISNAKIKIKMQDKDASDAIRK